MHLEGIDSPCILLSPNGEVPEQLVVDFGGEKTTEELSKAGTTTFRLEPSSADDPAPVFRELFDE